MQHLAWLATHSAEESDANAILIYVRELRVACDDVLAPSRMK